MKSRIRAVEIDILKGLVGIWIVDRVPNDEKIDEIVLRWLSHFERMENDRIAESVYVSVCVDCRLVWSTT